MTTTHTRNKSITAAVGAAIAGLAAPALLFLGAGTAQAIQHVSERGGVAIIDDAGNCPRCGGFNPQPDTPGFPDPGSHPPLIGNPDIHPGSEVGLGGPDPESRGVGDAEDADA